MNDGLSEDPYLPQRLAMVEDQLRRRGIHDARVLQAMQLVPRHEFIPAESRHEAYRDYPVPIGEGQTISQPYIVAAMIEALAVQPMGRVLEIGTGTGYEAAVLSQVADRVFTIERHPALAKTAREIFARLGYGNIDVFIGDGTEGLPEWAPFERIIVAAASATIPEPLVKQLADGGKMLIPIGPPDVQVLKLVRKIGNEIQVSDLDACRFVPLISGPVV